MPTDLGLPLPNWQPATLPPRETVRGRDCQLQPLTHAHAAQLWRAIAGLPDLWRYLPDGPFANQAEFAAWMRAQIARDDAIFWAICDDAGAALGLCAYLRLDPKNGSIEIGNILFSPALQRTRAATEAMFLLMRAIFERGFRRYEWKCNALNAPSRAAAQRLGFSYEGTFRNALVVKGRNRDTDWFSITDDEWPARKAALEAWLSPRNFDASGHQIARLEALRPPLTAPPTPSSA